jgi:hypothetical protein
MTHTNRSDIDHEREIRDWLTILNWRTKKADAEQRTWLPQIQGSHTVRAVFRVQDAAHLRLLVNALITAKHDFRKMQLPREDADRLHEHIRRPMQAFLTIGEDGRLVPSWVDDTSIRPFYIATALFVRIAAHVERWRVSGPCPNCRKYFLRKTRRDSKYHRGCRRSESGPRMKAIRRQQHDDLVTLARQGIEEYKKHQRRENWKVWTVQFIHRSDETSNTITTKSLTRWANKGELLPPNGIAN